MRAHAPNQNNVSASSRPACSVRRSSPLSGAQAQLPGNGKRYGGMGRTRKEDADDATSLREDVSLLYRK